MEQNIMTGTMWSKAAHLLVTRKQTDIQQRAKDKIPFKDTPPVPYFLL
jgi:hypothetical protein